ncbi:DUF4435 domain-containing protein [Actinocatenispora comari]|uniref:DUF4435 domain-containing protein n=1 Tax=Actinocatenispora comari TaxID=2807577 RepID=UPI001A90EC42|nr:DUF4435 domain-containing protein [Actinocatenispora comari]
MVTDPHSIKNYDEAATRIRLHHQADPRPVLVVEGPSDSRFLEEVLLDQCAVFPVGGRPNVLNVVREVEALNVASLRLFGILDRDFDHKIATAESEGLPIFPYENADLEAMAIVSSAFKVLVSEVASADKLHRFGGLVQLKKALYHAVEPLARLRAANAYHQWGLNFDAVDVCAKIDPDSCALKIRPYCMALVAKSSGSPPPVDTLVDFAQGAETIENPPTCPRGSRPYFRGRDLLSALAALLKRVIGTAPSSVTKPEHLEHILHVAFCSPVHSEAWTSELKSRVGISNAA